MGRSHISKAERGMAYMNNPKFSKLTCDSDAPFNSYELRFTFEIFITRWRAIV